MENNTFSVLQNNMILKVRKPVNKTAGDVWFLIHGWTGDENSMDPFWQYIPENHWIIAPRAPQPADPTGFGWADIHPHMYPDYEQFLPAVQQLHKSMLQLLKEYRLENYKINLFGFSQGAAASYMLAEMIQDQVDKILPTAGFMPDNTLPHLSSITNKSIRFIVYHGAKDKLVPLSMADQCVSDLQVAGFTPYYCVDKNAGHKLGASCIEHLKSIM